jgi:hypothetical protein
MILRAIPVLALAGGVMAAPTFNKDVLPILQNKCQGCHRPGEIGPMPLLTYQQSRPWAKAIREAVVIKRMPPWFAVEGHARLSNDLSLAKSEIDTIVAWVDGGAKEGAAKDRPKPREFVDGWNIRKPDLVLDMGSDFAVPATGTVEYQYIVIPTGFTEDKWIEQVEVRPSFREVVHHVVVFIRDPQSPWLRGEAQPRAPFVPPRRTPEGRPRNDIAGGNNEILTIYTPGMVPDIWQPGVAKLVKAGSDFVFQMHYTTNGKAGVDHTRIGVVFAKETPKERVMTLGPANMGFAIPPGDANYKVEARAQFVNPARLTSLFPHMHLRGKAFEYRLVEPSGESRTILRVDPYKFNWQLSYKLETPIELRPGSRIECSAWFDNSPNNPANPDAAATVRWGEQSWEEMMIGFLDVVIDARMDRRAFFTPRRSE